MNPVFAERQKHRPRCKSVAQGGRHQCGAESAPGSGLCLFHQEVLRQQKERKRESRRAYEARNRERIRGRHRAWRTKNRERDNDRKRERYADNRAAILAQQAEAYRREPGRENARPYTPRRTP